MYLIKIREEIPHRPGNFEVWNKHIIAKDFNSVIEWFHLNYNMDLINIKLISIELIQENIENIDSEPEIETNENLFHYYLEYRFVNEHFERPSPNDDYDSIKILSTDQIGLLLSKEYDVNLNRKILENLHKALEILNFEKTYMMIDYGKIIYSWKLKEKIKNNK